MLREAWFVKGFRVVWTLSGDDLKRSSGCCEGNQLIVYIAPTPDGRGAVNSWSVGKSGATWG
jgi:hypothetical protein